MRSALALLLLTALFIAGCDRVVAPPLVEVTELAPRQIEPGDRLEVRGTGFPQGHVGHVVLRGTIYRAGEPPLRAQNIELDGNVAAPERLEIPVRDDLAERLCGRGEKATHATFRGQVEISFASSTPGAPPLLGLLRQTTLDVLPATTRSAIIDGRNAEGAKVLAFLGIAPGLPTPRGLPIEQVGAGTTAERLGLEVGDVVTSVDGVSVLSLGDVLPASARSADLGIRRASGVDEIKTISLVGYASGRIPTEYVPALIIVALALVVLFLLLLPGPQPLVALELSIASRLRRRSWRTILGDLVGHGRHAAFSAIGSAVLATFALTPWVLGPWIDGPALLAVAATFLVWSRLATVRGFWPSVRMGAGALFAAVFLGLALVLAIADLGAIELAEIVRLQGAAPWEFAAARHPACAVLAIVYGGVIVALLRIRSDRSALERTGVVAASALAVVAFFGGWKIPGNVLLFGAGLFVVKTWLLAGLLLGAGRLAAARGLRPLVLTLLCRVLPGILLAGGLVFASRRLDSSVTLETVFALSLVALAALLAVRIAARVRAALLRPEPHASPFL